MAVEEFDGLAQRGVVELETGHAPSEPLGDFRCGNRDDGGSGSVKRLEKIAFEETHDGRRLRLVLDGGKGNVIDTQASYPDTVVASAIWHFEPTMDAAISAVKDGSFTAANYGEYSYMQYGGCSLAPLGTFEGRVPAEVMALVEARTTAIQDGSFTVEINDNEPVSS